MYRGYVILINNKDVINDANKMLEFLKSIFLKKYNCFENIPNSQNITKALFSVTEMMEEK